MPNFFILLQHFPSNLIFKKYDVSIWKSELEREETEKDLLSGCEVHLPDGFQAEARNVIQVSHESRRPTLVPTSDIFPGRKQGVSLEVEHLGHGPLQGGSGLTSYIPQHRPQQSHFKNSNQSRHLAWWLRPQLGYACAISQ